MEVDVQKTISAGQVCFLPIVSTDAKRVRNAVLGGIFPGIFHQRRLACTIHVVVWHSYCSDSVLLPVYRVGPLGSEEDSHDSKNPHGYKGRPLTNSDASVQWE